MTNLKIKKITFTALYSALALIAFYVESLFPPLIIPGAKMGVSNIFILLSVITISPIHGFITLITKVVFGSLFIGNFSAILYSLPSGIIAVIVEIIILRYSKKVSIISTSICGAVINITLQNLVFCLITGTVGYLVYLPYLAIIGVVGGTITGLTVYLAIKRLPTLSVNI